MTHAQIIALMVTLGVPVSPFMNYWTITELLRYLKAHTIPTCSGNQPTTI